MNNFKKELAVVVLFWNDFEKTIECLNSLFNQKKQRSARQMPEKLELFVRATTKLKNHSLLQTSN